MKTLILLVALALLGVIVWRALRPIRQKRVAPPPPKPDPDNPGPGQPPK